jgi:RNA polymerase sigma factor (sigma-70 family)
VSEGAKTSQESAENVPLHEERNVVKRLKNGDREAFARLYGWYADALYRQVILPRLPIPELAEDCLRNTFKTALEKIESFREHDRSIFFWLRRIAINKAMDVHRDHKRTLKLAESDKARDVLQPQGFPRPDRRREVDDTKKEVEQSLSKLNERYARALRLRLIEDRSREECAQLLAISVSTFDVLLHRAAKAFRKVYPP